MTKNAKAHALNQSPFFKLYSVPRLCRILGITRGQLDHLVKSGSNYHVFEKVTRGKTRVIEAPKPMLASVHSRIFKLLARIQTPAYLHSGVRGRSYLTNATSHDGRQAGFKLDIKSFYPSTSFDHVYQAFRAQFLCSRPVAKLLASLATIDGHLPTGSSLSQCMAFFAHQAMFDHIDHVVRDFGGQLTVYVDDLYVSVPIVKRWQVKRVCKIIESQGLEWHKERVYRAGKPKTVTGVVISPNGTRLPNSKHLKFRDTRREFRAETNFGKRLRLARSLSGQLTTGGLVDERLASRAVPARGYLRHLESLVPDLSD